MSLKAFYAFLECQNITVSRVRMSVIVNNLRIDQ